MVTAVLGTQGGGGGGGFNVLADIGWSHAYWAEGPEYVAKGYGDGDTITNLPDEISTADLTNGSVLPKHRNSITGFNSKPAFDFSAATDTVIGTVSTPATYTQPYEIFCVFSAPAPVSGARYAYGGRVTGGTAQLGTTSSVGGVFLCSAGTVLYSAVARDTNAHASFLLANSTSSEMRIDGNTADTGDAGTRSFQPVTLGNLAGGVSNGVNYVTFWGIKSSAFTSGERGDLLTWSQDHYGTP